jgi:MoaA/NifB/PqqE/SkfB family radical SAM enzyme
MENVIFTKKGVFVKRWKDFGAIVYSPFTGLFFCIAEKFVDDTVSFLNGGKDVLPLEISRNFKKASTKLEPFVINHWLPSKNDFTIYKGLPEEPILINWLISETCNFNCKYCYAADVMQANHERKETIEVASHILRYSPLAVVLSGGEPLLFPKLDEALNALGGKTGIIIDTNGYIYKEELIPLLKKYNAFVRISLDSANPKKNNITRPLKHSHQTASESLNIIFNNIVSYIKQDIQVSIQTVVSSINKNDLEDIYKVLPKLGANGWRLFLTVKPNNDENIKGYNEVMLSGKSKTIEDAVIDVRSKMQKFSDRYISNSYFSLQTVEMSDSRKNSVILVYPSGEFYTESILNNGKTLIDKQNPYNPQDIFRLVDLRGHYERYLDKI